MSSNVHIGRKHIDLLQLLGIGFCILLVAFALSSKMAAYYGHNDAARPIVATKVWQEQSAPRITIQPVQSTAVLPFLTLVIAIVAVAFVLFAEWLRSSHSILSASPVRRLRINAIRPPPRA